jgi:hypothetical protein
VPDEEDMTVDFLTGLEIGAGFAVALLIFGFVRSNVAELRRYWACKREAKRRVGAPLSRP